MEKHGWEGPVVLATGNPHKVVEMRGIFAAVGLEVVGLGDLPGHAALREPEEHGESFEANARIKAVSYAAQTGMVCLADDSGLEVDALNGAPGVISSHYASDGRETGVAREQRDRANNEKLLRELEGVPREERTARFVCVMVLAAPDGRLLAEARGAFEGRIGMPGEVPRGSNGFGYDPLFVLEDGRTSAELTAEEKNARSHRGAAAREMARRIGELRGS